MATGGLRQAGVLRAMAIIGAAGVLAVLLATLPHVLLAGGGVPGRTAPPRAGQPAPRPSGPGDAASFPATASPALVASAPAGCAGTCTTTPVPFCDEQCQERQLVLYNTNHVLPRPSDVPGITQQQIDEQRESIEAKITPVPAINGVPGWTPAPSPLPPPTLPPSPPPAPAAGG